MSYDVYLTDPKTGEPIEFDEPHDLHGPVQSLGGTTEAWVNLTATYGRSLRGGIWQLHGLSGADSLPVLKDAVSRLGDDFSGDVYFPGDGERKRILLGFIGWAESRPDGIWSVYP